MKTIRNILTAALALLLAACGTQKSVQTTTNSHTSPANTTNAANAKISFLDKVNGNASYQKNIVADITFKITKDDGKTISVPGQLRMRKNEVIRLSLQVPILGSEVGRIEFAKNYVLFVDRMHKEYVKASYDQVGFLRDNGINFYSLQALFWNTLLLPGKAAVGYGDLDKFTADVSKGGQLIPVTLKDGKLTYTWTAERSTGIIDKALVEYSSRADGKSTLTWTYSNFTNFGSRKFPYGNELTVVTPYAGKTKKLSAAFNISSISTSADWQAQTTLSGKYKQVAVEEILGKLTRL